MVRLHHVGVGDPAQRGGLHTLQQVRAQLRGAPLDVHHLDRRVCAQPGGLPHLGEGARAKAPLERDVPHVDRARQDYCILHEIVLLQPHPELRAGQGLRHRDRGRHGAGGNALLPAELPVQAGALCRRSGVHSHHAVGRDAQLPPLQQRARDQARGGDDQRGHGDAHGDGGDVGAARLGGGGCRWGRGARGRHWHLRGRAGLHRTARPASLHKAADKVLTAVWVPARVALDVPVQGRVRAGPGLAFQSGVRHRDVAGVHRAIVRKVLAA
mmetsp:Transcript_31425/g.79430  ORF Transcript_31425/g.79430 Transcript_31425/m.79430 type:complete len:269 (+) Transcript_31425:983-1789(+)